MVQFRDETWSSMLAPCTHTAWDAYNYANYAESLKALFGAENPYFSHPTSVRHTVAVECGRLAFVIGNTPGEEAGWGNISKAGTGWNKKLSDRVLPVSSCWCIHRHASSTHTIVCCKWDIDLPAMHSEASKIHQYLSLIQGQSNRGFPGQHFFFFFCGIFCFKACLCIL